jgi:hypothetical protein
VLLSTKAFLSTPAKACARRRVRSAPSVTSWCTSEAWELREMVLPNIDSTSLVVNLSPRWRAAPQDMPGRIAGTRLSLGISDIFHDIFGPPMIHPTTSKAYKKSV